MVILQEEFILKIDLNQLTLDLSDLEEIGSSKDLESLIEFPPLEFKGRKIRVPEPLNLKLNVYLADKSFFLSGKLKGDLAMECSRCLEQFHFPLNIDVEKELDRSEIKDIKNIDISNIIKNNVFLAIPIKPLCSEECQGLCPECGQNLNDEKCDCNTEIFDPRLAELEKFFDDDEE